LGREARGEVLCVRKEDIEGSKVLKEGRKEDDEGSKYLGKEVLAWKEGRY
jgi:hypothetical protein